MIDAREDGLRHGWTAMAAMACAMTLGTTLVGGSVLAACGGNEAGSRVKTPGEARPEALQHEACGGPGSRSDALDSNRDGKPDIQRYFDPGGHEQCRAVDLNHDGKPDLYEYFDAAGAIRRREFCYDDSGIVNGIESYDRGRLVQREYDISGGHKIDTWDWFDPNAAVDPRTGRPAHPVRRERDTTGDGKVDQWWTWNGDQLTIAVDRDGDGKPDPDTMVVFGSDGGMSAPPSNEPPGGGAPGATAANAEGNASDGGPIAVGRDGGAR